MRRSQVDKRSNRYVAKQSLSDFEYGQEKSMSEVNERSQGSVKFFNKDKGFGFCKRGNGGDVFIHANELKRSGIYTDVKTGDLLEFDVVAVNGKGPKGINIKVVSSSAM